MRAAPVLMNLQADENKATAVLPVNARQRLSMQIQELEVPLAL